MVKQPGTASLVVIIPAFDELENLKTLLPDLRHTQSHMPQVRLESFVVVERNAQLNDIKFIQSLGAHVIVRTPTDSFGDAIRSGIRALGESANYVAFMDADGSHSPSRLPDLLSHAGAADVVIASRYVGGGTSDNGIILRSMSWALNRAYSWVLGVDCRDVSTNFKLYHAEDVRRITLECNNFDVVEEILFRVQQLRAPRQLRIIEIPDHFAQRHHGSSKRRLGPFIVSYLWTLGRLRFGSGPSSRLRTGFERK